MEERHDSLAPLKKEPVVEVSKVVESVKQEEEEETRELIYTVKAGDTIYKVARRNNIKPTELAEKNGLKINQKLQIGQELKI